MMPNLRYGSILFLVFLGAYLFCRGFFLHRNLSSKTSMCSDLSQFHHIEPQAECWGERRYNRTVILVIDALKYEFTIHHDDSTAYWANRMPIFEQLRSQYPRQTFHARFIADSPTTTLQRLTALLTGSMPTFIDAATNFYQTSLNEDNLVKQMKLNDLNVVFMGDDTWTTLLPGAFLRCYPYPSFVVHDLHTVDNGVLAHIYDELATDDADVLIAHFLGVDHCGHWYSQDHPEMSSKLAQMNRVIANVSRQLRPGDLLVVFGDHGMTLSGDHGGDTDEEKSAALFMYAFGSSNLVKNYDPAMEPRVPQIDLVPSLSLLMGLPIPFPSLGSLIEPLFISLPIQGSDLVPLWINTQQVQRYVNSSSHLLRLIPHKVTQLNRLWDVLAVNFNDSLSANSLHRAATDYLRKVQTIARSAFTVFNIPFMGLGVIHLTLAALMAIFCARKDLESSCVSENRQQRSLCCWFVTIETAVMCLGQFSNSFVTNEDRASLFMLQGILLLVAGANKVRSVKLATFALMTLFRFLLPYGWVCRYEQGCQMVQEQPQQTLLMFTSVVVIASVLFAHRYLKKTFGRFFATSISAQLACITLYTGALCLLAFWFLRMQEPRKIQALGRYVDVLPNASVFCLIAYQTVLIVHRKYSKDRVSLCLNYVCLQALGICLLLSVYTTPRHVPSLLLHTGCLILVFLTRALPEELEGAFIATLMASTFFATGHQHTFQQIQWKAGFIGSAGSSLFVPGVRVVLNTFSGHILTGFLLPSILWRNASRSSLIAILISKLAHQCIACFVLRQHLMLWAVFATRLLFAIVELIVLLCSIVLGALLCGNSACWKLAYLGLLQKRNPVISGSSSKSDRFKS